MVRAQFILSLLLFASASAIASGPVAPEGWNGSFERLASPGQECCLPADLNGSGLTGGAFVLVADRKDRFAIFALVYGQHKGNPKATWQLLEHHPIAQLPTYRVSITSAAGRELPVVRACPEMGNCRVYMFARSSRTFRPIAEK